MRYGLILFVVLGLFFGIGGESWAQKGPIETAV